MQRLGYTMGGLAGGLGACVLVPSPGAAEDESTDLGIHDPFLYRPAPRVDLRGAG